MTIIALLWVLLVFPFILAGALFVGARIYRAGQTNEMPTPGITAPRFSVFRRHGNGAAAKKDEDKLPAV